MPLDLADQFAAQWNSGPEPPDVIAFLRAHAAASPADQLQVVLCDQRRRWQTAAPLTVEDYLTHLPALATADDAKLQLAVGEFQARRNGEGPLDIDQFTSRFTDLGETLAKKLRELLTDRSSSADDT